MNLLIDTHILLWWLGYPEKLSDDIKHAIENSANTVFISSAVIWEIIIKKQLGKLIIPDNLNQILEENNFTPLSINSEHIFTLEKLPHIHNDPFDRILIAQSIHENFILVTKDKSIKKYNINTL